jgi:hypothetical protein
VSGVSIGEIGAHKLCGNEKVDTRIPCPKLVRRYLIYSGIEIDDELSRSTTVDDDEREWLILGMERCGVDNGRERSLRSSVGAIDELTT